ncbi:uncharacterized protein PAC_01616 [Phialocephala subalpina]|uniref:Transcription elongation factor Eaf N-terminal domain-containing protein n=1 Tax=Phialocephala subalpina TaxID=576137 RepID=A0A1L7WG66_9HELO|nr:uncharacterized protein PAC_01616 [Phialocephala subalpina]
MAAGMIDIDKPGKYPIVLSDALLGKTSKEVYTGIRYNHKPDPSSSSPTAHLQPSSSDRYDLTLTDASEKYSYEGTRVSANGEYVLIFDPVKKHFVLHRIDSTFDMNIVSAPWSSDIRDDYARIEPSEQKPAAAPQRKGSKAGKKAAATKATTTKTSIPKTKVEKPKKTPKPAPPPREPTPEPEEDSDDGLTIEYPGAPTNHSQPPYREYNSTPIFQRNISEAESDEDEDAEGEEYEDERERNQDVDHLKLPSPAGNVGGMSDEDIEDELEAELEKALENESDESEEE